MENIIRKLSSRKLWLAIAGVATGVFIALGGEASEIETVAGAITALASAITYIFVEGKVDAAAVGGTDELVQDAIEVVTGDAD